MTGDIVYQDFILSLINGKLYVDGGKYTWRLLSKKYKPNKNHKYKDIVKYKVGRLINVKWLNVDVRPDTGLYEETKEDDMSFKTNNFNIKCKKEYNYAVLYEINKKILIYMLDFTNWMQKTKIKLDPSGLFSIIKQ